MMNRYDMIQVVRKVRNNDSWAKWFRQMAEEPQRNVSDTELYTLMEIVLSIGQKEE